VPPFPVSDVLSLIVTTTAVAGIIFAFSISYRRLKKAQKTYEERHEKTITTINALVTTAQNRLQQQTEKIDNVAYEAQTARISAERLGSRIDHLTVGVETALQASRTVIRHMVAAREQVSTLTKNQQALQEQIDLLDNRYRGMLPETEALTITPTALTNLTATEVQVLQILAKEGPKPAPELKTIIGRTREHTARLMKKLFNEGYVERDVRKIPFTYNISEKIRKPVEDSLAKTPPPSPTQETKNSGTQAST